MQAEILTDTAGASPRRALAALLAATALNLPYGTIYAFSVFLRPMEHSLGVSRTQMSLVFACATVMLTTGMNLAPPLARRYSGVGLLALSGLLGALGGVLVMFAEGFWLLLLGYGVLFGLGGGLSFTLVQQAVNRTLVRPSGLANGYVVSLYPLGAMIGAPLFSWTLSSYGLAETLALLALMLLAAGLFGAWLFQRAGIVLYSAASIAAPVKVPLLHPVFCRLFIVFFLAASAGLMVLGQAAGMLLAYGGSTALAVASTTFITGAIAASRLGGGWLVDRFAVSRVAAGAHLWALTGGVLITIWPSPWTATAALSMLGMGYGIMSGCGAGVIPQYWARDAFASVAARLYIAWCVAALCLPVLAGWLFDLTGGYQAAIILAAAGNLVGAAVAWGIRKPEPREGLPAGPM